MCIFLLWKIHTKQNAPFLQLFPHQLPRPHPPPTPLPPPMNLLGPSRPQGPPIGQISRSVQQFGFLENIHIHCSTPALLWGTQIKKWKNMSLLKFIFREILFYKYWIILKKIIPLQVPPLKPATLDLGPKSKIRSHNFVCLVEYFPKWYDMTL